jgi:hypothetical protein
LQASLFSPAAIHLPWFGYFSFSGGRGGRGHSPVAGSLGCPSGHVLALLAHTHHREHPCHIAPVSSLQKSILEAHHLYG